ncbi:MAG: lytic transglycosylase domain-containing protein [Clostridia bacterium]
MNNKIKKSVKDHKNNDCKQLAKVVSISMVCLTAFFVFAWMLQIVLYPIKFKTEIITNCKIFNVSPALVASVINAESRYNTNAISNKGAMGLMQILPSTATWIATQIGQKNFKPADLLISETNIKMGCFYLNYLSQKFFNLTTILSAYNAGEGVVFSWLSSKKLSADGKLLNEIPYKQTEMYVKKIDSNMKFYLKVYKW